VAARPRKLIANVGNFHTLAFRLGPTGIEGVFEHHTGLIDLPRLEALLRLLADGSLKHADVFGDMGHGALIYAAEPLPLSEGGFDVAVTGPRRNLFKQTAVSGPPSVVRGRQAEGGQRSSVSGPLLLDSSLPLPLIPYFAVPFGDMMIAGCFGLLAAVADVLPELGEPLRLSLFGPGGGTPPWEI